MIKKERLEELINEGATIWYVGKDYSVNANRMVEIRLGKFNKIENDYLLVKIGDGFHTPRYNFVAYLDGLFETQKQAEWSLKYQHIPRTEELNLPTWEEFFNSGKSIVFRDAYGDIQELKQYNREIYINEQYCGYLTEENYIKACDLCVKLFKGEEE